MLQISFQLSDEVENSSAANLTAHRFYQNSTYSTYSQTI